jgi:hypothetical protein
MRGRTLEHDFAEAGRAGDVAQAESFIANGADASNPMCIEYADATVMRLLLKRGVDPTFALQVCTNSQMEPADEKVRGLLEAGTDPHAVSQQGFSSVAHAIDRLHADTFLILMESGANPFSPMPGQPVDNPALDERFVTPRGRESTVLDRARALARALLKVPKISVPAPGAPPVRHPQAWWIHPRVRRFRGAPR